jgi:hypothetical protein
MGRIDVDGYTPAHLSYSTVSSYRMCAKKFQLQKILRLEEKPGLAAIGGNAVHSATEILDLESFSRDQVDTDGSGTSQSN